MDRLLKAILGIGKKNGAGIMKFSNGDQVRGFFQEGFLTGNGKIPLKKFFSHLQILCK